jgi:uncharacterized delta-60 repeat protein
MKKSNLYPLTTALLSLFLFFTTSVNAQDGANDATFNPIDIGLGDGPDDEVHATAIQSDGKIIIGGNFTKYNGMTMNHIARINTDGSVDPSFNLGTGASSHVNSIFIQSDGKIIIGGFFNTYNGSPSKCIARLNSDGSLDATFNVGGGANSSVDAIAIQSDGKIVIVGSFDSYNYTQRSGIARLNTNGSLDPTFNIVATNSNYINAVFIQSDGKIIIGGDLTTDNDITRKRIARLNTNGTLDITFNVGTGANGVIKTMSVQNDGKIIIGGNFTNYNGSTTNRIARLNTSGSLDPTFYIGTGFDSYPSASAIQSDGKIIIGGNFYTYNNNNLNKIGRLNVDGTLDATFNVGNGASFYVYSIAIQNDAKVIVGGYRRNLIRLNTNAILDASFNKATGANDDIGAIATQSDGKIIIGGNFTQFNAVSRNKIARLNADGTLDMSFNTGTGNGASSTVYTVSIQSDGKIIVGGSFAYFNGMGKYGMARLNTDGSLDNSFTNVNQYTPTSSAILSNGKIIIIDSYGLFRLNSDGTKDASFITNVANSYIKALSIQSDGKIVIGGSFTATNGITRNKIARLNSDGSLDATFDPGIGADYEIQTIAIQSDGKIIVAGNFTLYNNIAMNRIARLNANGTLDASYISGTGVNATVLMSTIQNDGKVIIGGFFTNYNGTAINYIARLNTNGTVDASFNLGTGADEIVKTAVIQSDGKIIIGGQFTSYNGARRNRIARILSTATIPVELVDFTGKNIEHGNLLTWTTASEINNKCFSIEKRQATANSWEVLGSIKANNKASNYQFTDNSLSCPVNYYRLRQIDNDGKETLSKVIALSSKGISKLKTYPNPVQNSLTIEKDVIGFYHIYNLLGQEVMHGSMTQQIDVSTLNQGTYILKVDTEQDMFLKL